MKTQIANVTKIASTNRLTRIASLAALLVLVCFASGAWAQQYQGVVVENPPYAPVPVTVTPNTPVTVTNTFLTPLNVTSQGLHTPFAYAWTPGQTPSFNCPYPRCVITHYTVGGCNAGPWLAGVGTYNGRAIVATNVLYTETNFSPGLSCGAATFSSKMFGDGNKPVWMGFSGTNSMSVVPSGMYVSIYGYGEAATNDDF